VVHPAQKDRMERIRQVKELLQEALYKSPDNWLSRSVRKDVINKVMIRFGCSERRAKEYVKIARVELEASLRIKF
jgi:hypothetical protein